MAVLALQQAQVEYDQRGAGPHLLLVHSLLTELPGFGLSSSMHLETVAAHADHVARVMDALELPEDTDVFGNGFGALVALEFAIRHGKRIGRLVVADTLAEKIPAARYGEIPDCGHCPMLEQPELLLKKMQEFLATSR